MGQSAIDGRAKAALVIVVGGAVLAMDQLPLKANCSPRKSREASESRSRQVPTDSEGLKLYHSFSMVKVYDTQERQYYGIYDEYLLPFLQR